MERGREYHFTDDAEHEVSLTLDPPAGVDRTGVSSYEVGLSGDLTLAIRYYGDYVPHEGIHALVDSAHCNVMYTDDPVAWARDAFRRFSWPRAH